MRDHAPIWLSRGLAMVLLILIWAAAMVFVLMEPIPPVPHADFHPFGMSRKEKN